jgi:hypothetical protein
METSETYSGTLTRQLASLLKVGDAGRAFGLRSLTECPYAVIFPFAIALRISVPWSLLYTCQSRYDSNRKAMAVAVRVGT